jgi:hypothetical protein
MLLVKPVTQLVFSVYMADLGIIEFAKFTYSQRLTIVPVVGHKYITEVTYLPCKLHVNMFSLSAV